MKYYKLEGHTAVLLDDLIVWAREFEDIDKRRVAETFLASGTRVSTVFLGLDHSFGDGPPLIFETIIFGGPHDGYQERFSTWEEAECGHQEALKIAQGEELGK